MSDADTERELLAKAISGDQVALHELLLVHYPQLTSYVATKIPRQIQPLRSGHH